MLEQSYDIHQSYQHNYERGPVFGSPPPVIPETPPKSFLGHAVASQIGIAAGLLLNSKWVLGYAARGFDLLTYKTVRSSHRDCYPLPNWVFVQPAPDEHETFYAIDRPCGDATDLSSAVCFGMPSMAPEIWREDVQRTKRGLGEDKLLIVSVVASPEEGWTLEDVAHDFTRCASWATEAGADVIEANFSCPNVCSAEGSIYLDPEASQTIAGSIRSSIGATPLLIKTGHFAEKAKLAAYLHALDGLADGVTLVNCITGRVLQRDGRPVFGETFAEAGVLGRAIHDPCVASVRQTAQIIARDQLGLSIAAVGGAASADDVARYFAAGADAVLMGSAPMYLPNLAAELKSTHPEW